MADAGLTFQIREGNDNGPPIPNATVVASFDPAVSGGDGLATVSDLRAYISAEGFEPYQNFPPAEPYRRPSLQGKVPISLKRKGESGIPRLQIVDGHFHDGTSRVHLRTITSYMLFNRFVRGEDLSGYCQYWRDLAGRGVEFRTTVFMGNAPAALGWPFLRPENYGNFWDALYALPPFVAKWGHRIKLTVFCDMHEINPRDGQGYQNDILNTVVDRVRPWTNVRVQLGNQWVKNGYNPQGFSKPQGTGLLFSKGSTAERWMPPADPWDWSDWDAGRRTKITDSESLINIANGDLDGSGHHVTGRHPCDSGEPIGVDELEREGSRTTNMLVVEAVRAEAEAFADAVCYHHQSGAFTQLPGPVQERGARVFFGVSEESR